MDHARFDALTRRVGTGLDRRAALRTGFGGIAATLGISRLTGTAQEATPLAPASPTDAGSTEFLFVQVATGGTWEPKPGDPAVYLLTLEGATAQTIYFSDRPAHIVGTIPTSAVLSSLGFTPADPPNAAVVTRMGSGDSVLLVELFNPVYDEVAATLTYEARILADYEGSDLAHFAARQGNGDFPAAFGEVSLFIDDATCPETTTVACVNVTVDPSRLIYTYENLESCLVYDGGYPLGCYPCEGAPDNQGDHLENYWDKKCNDDIAACAGLCRAQVYGTAVNG